MMEHIKHWVCIRCLMDVTSFLAAFNDIVQARVTSSS